MHRVLPVLRDACEAASPPVRGRSSSERARLQQVDAAPSSLQGPDSCPWCSSCCLTPEVVFLEKRVSELEKDTAASGEQHSRLRQENLQLVHR